MERSEFRVSIKHDYLWGKNVKWNDGNSAPLNEAVKRWVGEFKFGRTNDECRSGRPFDVTTPEIEKLLEIAGAGWHGKHIIWTDIQFA